MLRRTGGRAGNPFASPSAPGVVPDQTRAPALGILTRHAYPNYGSLLQTVALQSTLTGLGAPCEVIDYVRRDERAVSLGRTSLAESRVRESLAGRLAYRSVQDPNLAAMYLRFRGHQRRLLRLSPTIDDVAQIGHRTAAYRTVVVGSDQVWSPIHGVIDPAYFLEDVPAGVQAYSYAAGARAGSPAEQQALPARLARFEAVSVRERSAVDLLTRSGVDGRLDLDPVLLREASEWSRFAGPKVGRTPYILVYQLHTKRAFDTALAEVRDTLGLPVWQVTADARRGWRADRREYLVSPERFVALFRDAAHVVTDSFHGSAFSLLFGRPFTTVAPVYASERVSDLLAEFELPLRSSGDVTHVREAGAEQWALLDDRRRASTQYLAAIARRTVS